MHDPVVPCAPMITRLEIDGFKSLQGFAIDLDPLTVLIGPNSAGKSNILEALALLSRLATHPISDAFNRGRGRPSDQFTRTGTTTAEKMTFAVEFLGYGQYQSGQTPVPYRQSRYRYELTIARQTLASGAERLVAHNERLHAMYRAEDPWIDAHPDFRRHANYLDEGADALVLHTVSKPLGLVGTGIWPTRTVLSQHQDPVIRDLTEELARWRTLRVDSTSLGEPSDRLVSVELAADAANLPTILASLPKPLLGEIRADLVALVPGVASFDVVAEGDDISIVFELSGGDRMPARLASDGTLRILVLLTALRLEPRPPLICIEEPENGIFPGRLRALLDLFLAESRRPHDDAAALARLDAQLESMGGALGLSSDLLPTQILLTTHSPVLLAALRKTPQHLRFIDTVRRDGHRVTRVRTVGRSTKADHGRSTVSSREIEQLLDAVNSEDPA